MSAIDPKRASAGRAEQNRWQCFLNTETILKGRPQGKVVINFWQKLFRKISFEYEAPVKPIPCARIATGRAP